MNTDVLYSILISFSWFFLCGWTLLLLLASVSVFREELFDAGRSSGD